MQIIHELVKIKAGGIYLTGNLNIPEEAHGLVIFAHGSGSTRLSPRNQFVAKRMNEHRYATLLFDLLTQEESEVTDNRFNIEMLSQRLSDTVKWCMQQPETRQLPIGLFGASTGAASALRTAARSPNKIKAVVSRGGRPDMVMHELSRITAAVQFIVGSKDEEVLALNKEAFRPLKSAKQLVVVQDAGHLFEEAGKLEEVAHHALIWFDRHLTKQLVV